MPFYSDDLIEEVRSRNDIVDVIGNYVRLRRKGSTYFGLCPFHSEKTASFSVSPNKQMYYCFGCGAGGNVFTFLMQYENLSFSEAMEQLAERSGMSLPKQEMSSAQRLAADRRSRLLEINREAAKYYYCLLRSTRGQRAHAYFTERQLSEETMQRFGLGYSDQYSNDLYLYLRKKGYEDDILKDSGLVSYHETRGATDKFWNRAMFPIMDVRNRVIGFGGRVMGEGEPKYLNSPETMIFDKSRNLYGLHIARTTRQPQMILCEGYMDVIAMHQAGFDNAVASLGTALTSGHASLLKRYTGSVCLAYDSDDAGIRAALRAIPILKEAGLVAKVINMQPYKDPDEFIKALGREEFAKRIEEAENSFLFEVRMAQRQYDMKDPQGKTAFFREVSDKLLEFDQELERNNYIDAVAQRYRINPEELRRMVNQTAMRRGGVRPSPRPKSGMRERQKKEDGILQSQRLLLTWLAEDVSLFKRLKGLVTPEDFTEGLHRDVAAELFAQYQQDQAVNPARILNSYTDEEEQRQAAALFNAVIPEQENQEARDKALKETVERIKKAAWTRRTSESDPADISTLMREIEEKKRLQKIFG